MSFYYILLCNFTDEIMDILDFPPQFVEFFVVLLQFYIYLCRIDSIFFVMRKTVWYLILIFKKSEMMFFLVLLQ